MGRILKIDPDIQAALRPMTPEEWGQFSKNVLSDGKILEPLIVWKGKDIIVDGHHRWKAIQEFGLTDYSIEEKDFDDVDDAILWLLKHQKGRRNLNDSQLNLLIGRAYERQAAKDQNRNPLGTNQYTVEVSRQPDDRPSRTVEVVGEAWGVSPKTVERAAQFVEVLHEIEEKTSPETIQQIVASDVKIPTFQLAVMRDMADAKPHIVTEILARPPHERSKLSTFVMGSTYLDGESSMQDVALRFHTSKRYVQSSAAFARLVRGVEAIDPSIADWIMRSRRFPIEKAYKLLDETGTPIMGALKAVKKAIDSSESFDTGLDAWESFQKARRVGAEIDKTVAESDRKIDELLNGASSVCFLPNVRELYCDDCEWGFDTYLPEPGPVSCPYCKGDRISNRVEDWSPRRR